ncbi:sugar transferase [Kaistia adipata]|uniref:sugar transferase n=1 Tax=Kaistia adipata TaxID=166954 RepID=UPI001AEC6A6E|nr:sugar transferase [Kaistia adipata]
MRSSSIRVLDQDAGRRGVADPAGGATLIAAPRGYPLKRGIDVVLAAALLILMLPVGGLIALMIASGGGPVFYMAPRRGVGGRVFRMYKFRTMVPGADAVLEAQFEGDRDALARYCRCFKIERDPRVTPIGRFLRRFSLDELPQLLNVLRGEMSLVGPRPRVEREFIEEAGRGDRLFEAYYLCRPGMTGLWQVSGRSSTKYQTRLRLDADYARDISLKGDLVILALTIPVVLVGTGAY